MPVFRTSSKAARVGARRSPHNMQPAKTAPSTRRTTNAIAPPAAFEPAPPSAPSRKKRLPRFYIPPQPRNPSSIFATHFFSESKKSHPERSTESMIQKAAKLWVAYSDAEKLPYEMLAKAEMDLYKMRFPPGSIPEKRRRRKYAWQWGLATDHLFVVDAQGAIEYELQPVEQVPMFVPYEVDGHSYMGVVDHTVVSYPPVATDFGFSLESTNCVGVLPSDVDEDDLMDCDPPFSNTASSGSDYELSPLVVPGILLDDELDGDADVVSYGNAPQFQALPLHGVSTLFGN